MSLSRDEWNFSRLQRSEVRAALIWEVLRESPDVPEIVAQAKLSLEGRLSRRKPPLLPAQKRRWRGRNPRISEADKALIRAQAVFDFFIPAHEFAFSVVGASPNAG